MSEFWKAPDAYFCTNAAGRIPWKTSSMKSCMMSKPAPEMPRNFRMPARNCIVYFWM